MFFEITVNSQSAHFLDTHFLILKLRIFIQDWSVLNFTVFLRLFFFFFPLLDTFEMVSEDDDGKLVFKVNYHYMSQVKNASDANSAARARRLAQEAVTLSTSLPLSSSSSVFVRCDEERLDIMKVMFFLFPSFSSVYKKIQEYFICTSVVISTSKLI